VDLRRRVGHGTAVLIVDEQQTGAGTEDTVAVYKSYKRLTQLDSE